MKNYIIVAIVIILIIIGVVWYRYNGTATPVDGTATTTDTTTTIDTVDTTGATGTTTLPEGDAGTSSVTE